MIVKYDEDGRTFIRGTVTEIMNHLTKEETQLTYNNVGSLLFELSVYKDDSNNAYLTDTDEIIISYKKSLFTLKDIKIEKVEEVEV